MAFARPAPPLFPIDASEFMWLVPVGADKHFAHVAAVAAASAAAACADDCGGNDENGGSAGSLGARGGGGSSELCELMTKAFRSPLMPAQQQQALALLASEGAVLQCGLAPPRLAELVENNPMVAIECLLKLAGSPLMTEFLSQLVSMEMSLHSMEVATQRQPTV